MGSRNDKLFQKRKAKKPKDLARRKATLPVRKMVLIVCEGEKTELLYLNDLVDYLELTTVQVKISGDCGSAPISVVKFGLKELKSELDFEMVFFVFDKDTHPSYDDALRLVEKTQNKRTFKKKTIAAITSIPCFEIWFLLHFGPHAKPYTAIGNKSSCACLISDLKKNPEFKDYEKGNRNYFKMLSGRLPKARKNAAQTLKQSQTAGEAEHHGNPTTLMHILIDALKDVAAEYT